MNHLHPMTGSHDHKPGTYLMDEWFIGYYIYIAISHDASHISSQNADMAQPFVG